MRDGRSYTLDIKRSIHASLIWDAKQLGEEETDRPSGYDDAHWYVQPRLLNDVRLDADTVSELAVMTCTRWHKGWLAQITYIDIPKGSGLIAAAIDTGTELTFADESVRAVELVVSMCDGASMDTSFGYARGRSADHMLRNTIGHRTGCTCLSMLAQLACRMGTNTLCSRR